MVLEIAELFIRPGTQDEFDQAIRQGVETVIAKSPGFRGFEIQRGIESAERYVLLIEWDSLESHTVDFRGSESFARWRAIVSPFFAKPPHVEHFHRVAGTRVSNYGSAGETRFSR